jgi:hypothetical protein
MIHFYPPAQKTIPALACLPSARLLGTGVSRRQAQEGLSMEAPRALPVGLLEMKRWSLHTGGPAFLAKFV